MDPVQTDGVAGMLADLLRDGADLPEAAIPVRPGAMLATLTHERFSDPGWIYERKLDGVRCLAAIDGGSVRLVSRTGQGMNGTYPELVESLEGAAPPQAVLDGEVVAFEGSRTSFSRLQGRMQVTDPAAARRTGIAVFYYLFDVLHLCGRDTRRLPLRERKQLLRRAVSFADPLRFTAHRNRDGEAFFADACRRGWEGLIAKRADAPYVGTRSSDWLKFRCDHRQEFVVCGWTPPKGSRVALGALALAYRDGDRYRYAGLVGTGFDTRTLHDLHDRLGALPAQEATAHGRGVPRDIRWVRPRLVVEVAFTEWTDDGKLRHPRYLGVRTDKDPHEVVREETG